MNSGVNVNDPVVIAAFKSALLHQGIIALLIFGLLGLVWITARAWRRGSRLRLGSYGAGGQIWDGLSQAGEPDVLVAAG
jgi:hypothetical protein